MQPIAIDPPKFELHESVGFRWKGKAYLTKITARHYNIDEERWMYGVQGLDKLCSGRLISRLKESTKAKLSR